MQLCDYGGLKPITERLNHH